MGLVPLRLPGGTSYSGKISEPDSHICSLWGLFCPRDPPPGRGRCQVPVSLANRTPVRAPRRGRGSRGRRAPGEPGISNLSEVLISKHLM